MNIFFVLNDGIRSLRKAVPTSTSLPNVAWWVSRDTALSVASRASCYNAQTLEGVNALVQAMKVSRRGTK